MADSFSQSTQLNIRRSTIYSTTIIYNIIRVGNESTEMCVLAINIKHFSGELLRKDDV